MFYALCKVKIKTNQTLTFNKRLCQCTCYHLLFNENKIKIVNISRLLCGANNVAHAG